MAKLCFLEVGCDPKVVERDQRHQVLARGDVLVELEALTPQIGQRVESIRTAPESVAVRESIGGIGDRRRARVDFGPIRAMVPDDRVMESGGQLPLLQEVAAELSVLLDDQRLDVAVKRRRPVSEACISSELQNQQLADVVQQSVEERIVG